MYEIDTRKDVIDDGPDDQTAPGSALCSVVVVIASFTGPLNGLELEALAAGPDEVG